MHVVFLDTNTFLHYPPLQDINWTGILRATTLTISVPFPILRELDDLKEKHPNKVLRERATRALQHIETNRGKEIRTGVTLVTTREQPSIDFAQHHLNPTQTDDQLVASILTYQAAHPDDEVLLVTSDTTPRLVAQDLGIATLQLPDELRLPTTDAQDAEIKKLKSEIDRLKNTFPDLNLTFPDGEQHTTITLPPPTPRPTSDEIKRAVDKERQAHPPLRKEVRQDLVSSTMIREMLGPPTYELARYNKELLEYFTKYEEYLNKQWEFTDAKRRTIMISVGLHNKGRSPATDIDITLHIPNLGRLSEHDFRDAQLRPPALPKQPRTQQELNMGRLMDVPSIPHYTPYVPQLWNQPSSGPEITEAASAYVVTWSRQTLKHGSYWTLPPVHLTLTTIKSFAMEYEVHAGNHPDAFTGTLHLIIKEQ